MVPYGVFGRTTTNIVVEYSGVQSTALTYNVALSAPGVYTLNQQGTGPGAILNQDGVTVNSVTNPEKRGNVIAIYMTGEGQTNPQGVDGAIIPAGGLRFEEAAASGDRHRRRSRCRWCNTPVRPRVWSPESCRSTSPFRPPRPPARSPSW